MGGQTDHRQHEQQIRTDAESRQGRWVVPAIEDLGTVTEITLRGSAGGTDRRQRGSFSCTCEI
jgi:hypothetical protein